MKLLDWVEKWHNHASDLKVIWFPFVFLMPAPELEIDLIRKLKMSVCFGIYFGICGAIRSWLWGSNDFLMALLRSWMGATLFFAVWFSVVTAPLWNRRARRLQRHSQ